MKNMMPEYVDELKPYDIDMLEHSLMKNARDYKANNAKNAVMIVQNLLDKTLKKVGVHIVNDEREVDKMLHEKGVKVEHRTHYKDAWRNGIYVYKNMDLVGFISEPIFKRPSVFEIDRAPCVVVRAALQ